MQNSSEKIKIIFCGMPDMATICLHNLVQKNFEISAVIPPPNSNPTASGFINFARSLALEVFEYDENPNTEDLIEKIAAKNADIGVICSFNHKLGRDFLNTTKMGYINCHPSLLPMYRGANPYFHIINNGEKTTGVTLHFADEHFDTGEIIAQKGFLVSEKETIGTLFNRSNFIIADLLVNVLNIFQDTGKINSKAQPEGNFKKAPKIQNELKIDLNNSPASIERLVRAANPFYNAYLNFRGSSARILCVDYKIQKHDMEPGIITKISGDDLEISAKDGFIYPRCIQCGSWGIFDAANFIKVFRPNTGEFFN